MHAQAIDHLQFRSLMLCMSSFTILRFTTSIFSMSPWYHLHFQHKRRSAVDTLNAVNVNTRSATPRSPLSSNTSYLLVSQPTFKDSDIHCHPTSPTVWHLPGAQAPPAIRQPHSNTDCPFVQPNASTLYSEGPTQRCNTAACHQ